MAESESVHQHTNRETKDVYEIDRKPSGGGRGISVDIAGANEIGDRETECELSPPEFSHDVEYPATQIHIQNERVVGSERQESIEQTGVLLDLQSNQKEEHDLQHLQEVKPQKQRLDEWIVHSRSNNDHRSDEGKGLRSNSLRLHDEARGANPVTMTGALSRSLNEQNLRDVPKENMNLVKVIPKRAESDSALISTERVTADNGMNGDDDMTDTECHCLSNDSGADMRSHITDYSKKKSKLCKSKVEIVEYVGNNGENAFDKETREEGTQCEVAEFGDGVVNTEKFGSQGISKVELLNSFSDHPVIAIRSDSLLYRGYGRNQSSFRLPCYQDWDISRIKRSQSRDLDAGGYCGESEGKAIVELANKLKEEERKQMKRKRPAESQSGEELVNEENEIKWYNADDGYSEDSSTDNDHVYRDCLPFKEAARARSVCSSLSSESQIKSIFAMSPIFSLFQSALDITNSCDPSFSDGDDEHNTSGKQKKRESLFSTSLPSGNREKTADGIRGSHLMSCSRNLGLGSSYTDLGHSNSFVAKHKTSGSASTQAQTDHPNRRARSSAPSSTPSKTQRSDSFPKVKFLDNMPDENDNKMERHKSTINKPFDMGSTNNSQLNEETDASSNSRPAASTFIGEYLYELWKNECLCDVRIRIGNQSFLAHKIVLAAFSDVFCPSEPMPNPTIMVDVPNSTSHAVFQILQYLYTSEMNITDDTIEEILSAALFLGVTDVVDLVKDILSHPTRDNIIGYLDIADRMQIPFTVHEMPHLFQEYLQDIWDSNLFKSLTERDMRLILTDQNIKVDSESDLIVALVKWIEGDFDERQHLTPSLLRHINFVRIVPDELARTTNEYPHIFQNTECQSILAEVYKSFAIIEANTDPLDVIIRGVSRTGSTRRSRKSHQSLGGQQSASLSRLSELDRQSLGMTNNRITQAMDRQSLGLSGSSVAMIRQSQAMGGPSLAASRHSQAMGGPSLAASRHSQAMGGPSMAASRHSQAMGGPSLAASRHSQAMGGPSLAASRHSQGLGRYSAQLSTRQSQALSRRQSAASRRQSLGVGQSSQALSRAGTVRLSETARRLSQHPTQLGSTLVTSPPCCKPLSCADCIMLKGICGKCRPSCADCFGLSGPCSKCRPTCPDCCPINGLCAKCRLLLFDSCADCIKQNGTCANCINRYPLPSTRSTLAGTGSSSRLSQSVRQSQVSKTLDMTPVPTSYESDTNATLLAINNQFRRATRMSEAYSPPLETTLSKKQFRIAENENVEHRLSEGGSNTRRSFVRGDRSQSLSPRESMRGSNRPTLRASSVPRSTRSSRSPPTNLRVSKISPSSPSSLRPSVRMSQQASSPASRQSLRMSTSRRSSGQGRMSSAPIEYRSTLKTIDNLDGVMTGGSVAYDNDHRQSRGTIPVVLKTPRVSAI